MRRVLIVALVFLVAFSTRAFAVHEAQEVTEGLADWEKRIHISGILEGDYAWTEHEDAGNKDSGSASDLFLSTLEVAISIEFTDWITSDVVFLAEDIGTEDETDVTVDEATITYGKEEVPVYVVFGKRALPFGIYENHLLTDPMTQDAYETNRVGLTLGFIGFRELDVSASLYDGEEMMAHLFESELFDAEIIERRQDPSGNDVASFILSASIAPLPDHLYVFGGYLSEPGFDDRNDTVTLGTTVAVSGLRLDAEYMKAVSRETYAGFDREFKESVISLGAAYEFVLRERTVVGGALFAERKEHVVSEPLEVAVRYESFDDDDMADESQTWAVENRISAGARYAFYKSAEKGLAAYVGAEYRYTDYTLHSSQENIRADDNSEIIIRLGVTF